MWELLKKRFMELFQTFQTNDPVCRRRCLVRDEGLTGPQSAKQRKVENSFIHMSSYDFLVPFFTNISGNKMNISHTLKTFYNSSKRLDLFKKSQSKENVAMESKLGNENVTDNVHLLRPTMKLKLKYKENRSNSFKTPAEEDQDDIQVIREVPCDKQTDTEDDVEIVSVTQLPSDRSQKVIISLNSDTEDDIEIVSVTQLPSDQTQKVVRHPVSDLDWISPLTENYGFIERGRQRRIDEKELRPTLNRERNEKLCEDVLEECIKNQMKITDLSFHDDVILCDDEPQLPKLTPAMESIVSAAFQPDPRSEVLVEAFSLKITRYDVQSLAGTNWLNDEVINFYMNLLIERGKSDNYPSVYAFNTFFYPKLASSGYSSLKRWTRKVDVFTHDIWIVPVHLGMHWCMAAIDFRNKSICYYDSLGAPNNQCLMLLMNYLECESMDKKKIPFDSEGWYVENAKNIPQQMNGNDCGMFSCTYAEFICRNAKFTFSQKEMPYFRRKMVYEILSKKLLL